MNVDCIERITFLCGKLEKSRDNTDDYSFEKSFTSVVTVRKVLNYFDSKVDSLGNYTIKRRENE